MSSVGGQAPESISLRQQGLAQRGTGNLPAAVAAFQSALRVDANDVIYAFDASRYYNPEPGVEKIIAPLFAINSADDEVNPPELNLMEPVIKRVRRGRYILIPTSDKTSGHGTHSNPPMWDMYLKELLEISAGG